MSQGGKGCEIAHRPRAGGKTGPPNTELPSAQQTALPQGLLIDQSGTASIAVDHTPLTQLIEAAGCGLPGEARHRRQLPLGQGWNQRLGITATGAAVGQIQQHRQQARGGITPPQQEALVHGLQALGLQAGQSESQPRIVMQLISKWSCHQPHRFKGGQGHHIGAAHSPQQHCHIAEQIARTEHRHHDLGTIRGKSPHLHEATQDQQRALPLILKQQKGLIDSRANGTLLSEQPLGFRHAQTAKERVLQQVLRSKLRHRGNL